MLPIRQVFSAVEIFIALHISSLRWIKGLEAALGRLPTSCLDVLGIFPNKLDDTLRTVVEPKELGLTARKAL